MMNKVARAEIADSRWSWLYKVGGAARNKDASPTTVEGGEHV